jgi:hypothetical protein
MSLLDRRHAIRTPQAHAAFFHSRKRRAGQAGFGLGGHRTHLIRGALDFPTTITTADLFPARDIPIFFTLGLVSDGAIPAGLLFELGSSARGIAASLNDGLVTFTAGSGTIAAERATATWAAAANMAAGHPLKLAFSIEPGIGRVRIFWNGVEMAQADASGGDFNGDWSDAGDGSFAQGVNGTTHTVTPTTAPADFVMTEPLSVFRGQLPRQLHGIQLGDL